LLLHKGFKALTPRIHVLTFGRVMDPTAFHCSTKHGRPEPQTGGSRRTWRRADKALAMALLCGIIWFVLIPSTVSRHSWNLI